MSQNKSFLRSGCLSLEFCHSEENMTSTSLNLFFHSASHESSPHVSAVHPMHLLSISQGPRPVKLQSGNTDCPFTLTTLWVFSQRTPPRSLRLKPRTLEVILIVHKKIHTPCWFCLLKASLTRNLVSVYSFLPV